METHPTWLLIARGSALGVPLSYLLAAVFVRGSAAFRHSTTVGAWAFGLAGFVPFAMHMASSASVAHGASNYVRADGVTYTMLLLVTGLGLAITRYSDTYMGGDAGRARYVRWLMATLGAVTTLVIANHLLVIALAWTATGLALHKLLTFYAERPVALVAAHKKFLVSRLADAALWTGAALVYGQIGSGNFDVINAWIADQGGITPALQWAALLFVLAACLKSAQLPFHGWLTQVMEAPTPVSALLHAGVVNLGGLLMIRLAPLMAHAPGPQLLLVIVGVTTLVVASLVTTTRVSIKVALAWSTVAQMGMLLAQCGLGAWHLALLHLVAHSLYKAHAFLGAAGVVAGWRQDALVPRPPRMSALRFTGATFLAISVAAGVVFVGRSVLPSVEFSSPLGGVLVLMLALSLIPLVAHAGGTLVHAFLVSVAASALFLAWHTIATHLWPTLAQQAPSFAGVAIFAVGIAALFVTQTLLTLRPQSETAQTLRTWLFAGLFLDELFTRLTFRMWPPRLPLPASAGPTPIKALVENAS